MEHNTHCTSAGSAIGPPWHSTKINGLTATTASRITYARLADTPIVRAVPAPIEPLVVSPIEGTNIGPYHLFRVLWVKHERASKQVKLTGGRNFHLKAKLIPVTSSIYRYTSSIQPTAGNFFAPSHAISLSCLRKTGVSRNGKVRPHPDTTLISCTAPAI